MVAHDLRTILQGIALTAEVLAQESAAEKGSKVHARAQMIQRSSARMNRLIGDLVDVAAIETGRPLVMPKAGELELLLREIDEGLRPSAALHHLTFTSEVIGRPPVAASALVSIFRRASSRVTAARSGQRASREREQHSSSRCRRLRRHSFWYRAGRFWYFRRRS